MFDWQRLIPRYWSQNNPTNWDWDAVLNKLLDEHGAVTDGAYGAYTAKVGPVTVWVSNYPYAFGTPYQPVSLEVMPSVATRKRLRKEIIAGGLATLVGERSA